MDSLTDYDRSDLCTRASQIDLCRELFGSDSWSSIVLSLFHVLEQIEFNRDPAISIPGWLETVSTSSVILDVKVRWEVTDLSPPHPEKRFYGRLE